MPAKSKSQQRLMGVAYAVKKGDMQLSDVDAEYRDEVKGLVDGILSKTDGDYGAAVGMLTSSLGESLNTQLSEGKMSELNNMAVDAGSLDKFMKDAYKEYGWKKNQETDEFLADFYKESTL